MMNTVRARKGPLTGMQSEPQGLGFGTRTRRELVLVPAAESAPMYEYDYSTVRYGKLIVSIAVEYCTSTVSLTVWIQAPGHLRHPLLRPTWMRIESRKNSIIISRGFHTKIATIWHIYPGGRATAMPTCLWEDTMIQYGGNKAYALKQG